MSNRYMKRAQVERDEEWIKIIQQIPSLRFPASWSIQIIPPFCGAIARFIVTKGDARVSVYADFYEVLGFFGGPHWEIYPDASGENERFAIAETGPLISEIGKSLARQIACAANAREPKSKGGPMTDLTQRARDVAGRLLAAAQSSSAIQRQMAEAKSLQQGDNPDRRTNLYDWPKPEQTLEGKTAAVIAELIAALEAPTRR